MKIEYHGGENLKKFIVEFGMGTDFHGQDVTKAAKKAVKDAVSRSCLCGLEDVLGLTDFKRQVGYLQRSRSRGRRRWTVPRWRRRCRWAR